MFTPQNQKLSAERLNHLNQSFRLLRKSTYWGFFVFSEILPTPALRPDFFCGNSGHDDPYSDPDNIYWRLRTKKLPEIR